MTKERLNGLCYVVTALSSTFQELHGSFVLSHAVLQLSTGLLQVSLQLLVLLLQLADSLAALVPAPSLSHRVWKKHKKFVLF